MGFQYSCLIIQRIILPIIFIICCLGRPVGTSLVYLLMYFILPFIPIANSSNLNGLVTAYFIILIALSSLILTAHIGLQIAIAIVGPELIQKCSFEEILLRHIGFIRFNDFQVLAIVEWILLDIVFFLTTIIIYVIIKKLVKRDTPQSANVEVGDTIVRTTSNNLVNFQSIIKVAPALCLASLFLTAVFRPSLIGAIYFLVFLFTSTYWAFYKSFGRGFGILMRAVMFILVFHIIAIVSYQTPWAQEYLNNSSLPARLTALEPLALSTCRNDDDIRQLSINSNLNIDSYLSPIMVLLSYYILALTSKCLISKKVLQSIESPDELSERTPLVRKKRPSEPKTPKGDAIPLETVGEVPEEQNYVWLDQIWYIFQGIGEFIYQNSYIFTNIIMMAWSIIYHSWLTFVLLIWSNILWMIPNQRKAMLRSSPFIVLYAELLVTAQYIYGMNFEGEIPGTQAIRPDMDNATRIGIEKEKKYFAQIGFEHPDRMPCLPIIVKTLFTIMFWTTLRQLFKESKDKKRTSALADMVAPLQLTVGAATSDLAPQSEVKKKPKFFDNAGNYLKDLLIKAWIWLLILIIFLCGLIGQTMTGFRIFYMALFLTFVLIFQCSWKVWLKMMYGFWLFLIVYAMATLILIYTYQFDGFTTYWHDYFGISPTLQNDIGLKVYVTKDLFLHLVTPTLILIMTIVQLHYVHNRFVQGLQKQETKKNIPEPSRNDLSLKKRESDEPKELTDPSKEKTGRLAKLKKKFSKKKMETFMERCKRFLKDFQEFSWMFLELHLLKAVFIVAFVVCVAEVCVLHISIVLLCVIALVSKQSAQIFISRVISILVSIFIISKMIYQVDYINHSKFDVHCNNNQTTDVNNTAEWIGLDKIESGTSLMKLLRRYLIYMIFSTLHAVVVFRQFHARKTENTESLQLIVIFPKITREEAERNLLNLLKYLVNYGYMRFGLELTLIILVGVIGYRQDMYAILYAFWLCLLINLSRAKCAKAWPFFQGYTGFVLILQYLQFVGIPPGLCYEYLYENFGQPKILGVWAVLPGPYLGGTARRMLFDFILLLFIARQSRVFKLEAKIKRTNEEFPGGTNEPIIENYDEIDNEKFVNPTHDFTTNVRNWLDIFKNAILLGWFWVTLAVVFLAGTSSASLLSLGYLIGSFAFLWQGSDFYLRPIKTILKWWYLLIHYNVAAITVKTVIQLGGCLFYDELKSGANWFVYLLGVSCLKYNEHQVNVEEHVELFEEIDTYFGLSWDAICFVFLIFQLRIFKSYYFIHIINDTKADTILASRGAEIIEDLRQKQIAHKHKHEKGVLVKIKMKMEKIRATQRKMFRPIEKQTHLQETVERPPEPVLHPQAVRAGDYYMFDDPDEKIELDLLHSAKDFLADDEKIADTERKISKRKTLFEDGQAERPKTPVKPSSSKEQPGEDEQAEEEELDGQQPEQNIILRILNGALVSIAIRLHGLSRNYRYVMKILSEEKKMLKETEGFGEGRLIGSVGKWPPSEDEQIETLNSQTHIDKNIDNKSQTSSDESESDIKTNTKENDDYTTLEPSFRVPKLDTDSVRLSAKLGDSDFELEDDEFIARDHHIIVEVCIALWYAILSNTDLICYFIVFVNQVASASILSLPLPIMAFLWGTLTIPRPSKTFWVTLIAYTQCVVIIKCIFQYKMIWIDHQSLPNEPLAAEKIIGIEQKDNYATFDLILLLVLFFHRFVLKSQGLWKSETRSNEEAAAELLNDDQGQENDVISQRESRIDAVEKEVELPLDPTDISTADPDDVSLAISEKKSSRPHVPAALKIKSTQYLSSITDFFKNLIHKPRLPTDVYACMFLCEFTNFFILLFGFTAFSAQQGDGGVSEYLAENKVPLPFLIMLLLQFCLIIIDRALYLRKALLYKILFHYCSIFGIHIWMFFVIPAVTEARFNSLKPPIIFYMIKCIYLLLSSYQIRCGYPKRILGNFLTKGYSVVNMASFKLYKLTPFLYELRTFLDWVCTETTMTLWDWLKMEDIFSEIYFIKCSRELEETFPVMRATKKPMISKILVGGTFILVIVIIIWAPLALFALSSAVGYANVPTAIQATLKIGSYEPIYTADVKDNIKTFSKENLTNFLQLYIKDKYAVSFITGYDAEDVATIELPANSASTWEISPPDKERLIDDLIQNRTLTCRFSYSLFRVPPNDKSSDKISGETRFEITPEFPSRKNLIAMLQGQSVEGNVTIPDMLPKFLKVQNNNLLGTIHQLNTSKYPDYGPFVLKLHSLNGSGLWWEIRDCLENEDQTNSTLPFASCEKLVIYTFSDKKFPSTFSFFTAGGIIGMYTTFVILVSRYLRTGFSGSGHVIQFVDLPYVDRMLQMCLDVYLVREAKEFALEEDLFAKLIFLYRSPETRIKWSRLKKEKSITASTEGSGSKKSLTRPK